MNKLQKRNTAENDSFLTEKELPETFAEILKNVRLRRELMTYLQSKLAEENLLFYESVLRYKNLPTTSLRTKIGNEMLVTFIAEDSLYWVNLSHGSQSVLLETVDFKEDTFDEACGQIECLMSANFFDSFKKHLLGNEEKRKAKTSSFESWRGMLGKLNASEDEEIEVPDCGCQDTEQELCCSKRELMISNIFESKTNRKLTTSVHQKMFSSLLGKSTTNISGAVMTPTKKRAKNAFRRIFHKGKSKKGARMSFWKHTEQL